MKILIIEDDRALARSIKQELIAFYVVDVVHTGGVGLARVKHEAYDLVLLDLGLPDIAGEQLCKQIRTQDKHVPILIVTGDAETESKVALLDAGADDYITKPFSSEELKARVRALMRRQAVRQPVPKQLIVGDLVMDTERHEVVRRDVVVKLRAKEYLLLEYLMSHPKQILTRPALINAAWDQTEDNWTNTIEVHISRLREKIDRPFDSHMLKTVHGLGYRLDPDPK